MSRVIVKGLPPSAGEAQLRALLAPFVERTGALTDVRCARTGGGAGGAGSRPRGFAFVGFREARGAAEACRALNGAFIGSSRTSWEPARPVSRRPRC